MVDSIIVGTTECPVRSLVLVLKASENFTLFHENWPGFAADLAVNLVTIKKFKQDLVLEKSQLYEVVNDVICDWVSNKGSGATLENLRRALVNNGMKIISDIIKAEFQVKSTEFNKPSYYVKRALIGRNIIDKNRLITKASSTSDIFLFTGITRPELSQLFSNQTTDNSTNQIDEARVKTRFLILDHPIHFQKLSNKASTSPAQSIHLINVKNGRLAHIKSNGNLNGLRDSFIAKVQTSTSQTEDEFVSGLGQIDFPVCISDTPGMGKSMLLENIGGKLRNMFPNRTILLLTLSTFIKTVKQNETTSTRERIESSLLNMVCQNQWERASLLSKLHSKDLEIELLLDGLDEVNSGDLQFAFEGLKFFQKAFISVRLWITTRPHLLYQLEDCLNVFGYNIQPFTEQDQVQFLNKFWKQKHQDLDCRRLTEFSKSCLQVLKSELSEQDDDIAGVPLQCLLIAEVFEESASESCSIVNPNTSGIIKIASLTELYKRLIDKKLAKYNEGQIYLTDNCDDVDKLSDSDVIKQHMSLAVRLIFPSFTADEIQNLGLPQNLKIDQLLNVGILASSSTIADPKFIHRTIGEYFIAKFIAEIIYCGNFYSEFDKFKKFICTVLISNYGKGVGAVTSTRNDVYMHSIYTFSNSEICYFVNFLLQPFVDYNLLAFYTPKLSIPQDDMIRLVKACTCGHLINVFSLFDHMFDFNNILECLDKKYVLLTVRYSNLAFVKIAFDRFEKQKLNFDTQMQHELLDSAVKNGSVSILEYLINVKKLGKFIKGPIEATSSLLHSCVEDSLQASEYKIKEKVELLRFLIHINPKLLEALNNTRWIEENAAPLLSRSIHISLIKELIKMGADIMTRDFEGDTVFHSHAYYIGELRACLNPEEAANLTKVKNQEGSTPLLKLLEVSEAEDNYTLDQSSSYPLNQINELFELNADFNCKNKKGHSVLAVAIMNGRSSEIIRKLISCGANVWWKKGWKQKTLLHYAGAYGNLDVLRFLMNEYGMKLSSKDLSGTSTADYLLNYISKFRDRPDWASDANLIDILRDTYKLEEGNFYSRYCNSNKKRLELLKSAAKEMEEEEVVEYLFNNVIDLKDKSFQRVFYNSNILCDFTWSDDGNTNINVIKTFVNAGINVYHKDPLFRYTFLHELLDSKCHVNSSQLQKLAEFLIERGHAELFNTVGGDDQVTPFHLAAQNVNLEEDCLRLLHSSGVDFHAVDKNGRNCLFHAIDNESGVSVLEKLISFGVNKMHLDKCRMNLLHYAASVGSLDTLKFVINQGSDINSKDKNGETPIFHAVRDKNFFKWMETFSLEKVKLLKENGADLSILTNLKLSLLHKAVILGSFETVQYLLEEGMDVNCRNIDGESPLHMLMIRETNDDYKDVVKDDDYEDSEEDRDSEDLVEDDDYEDLEVEEKEVVEEEKEDLLKIAKLLVEWGADVNLKDVDKLTPLKIAKKETSAEIYEKLRLILN